MKKPIAAIIFITAASIVIISLSFRDEVQPPDAIFINDAVQTAIQSGTVSESVNLLTDRLTQAFSAMDAARNSREDTLQIQLIVFVCVLALLGIGVCLYFERTFFTPFRRLQKFAHRIAAGNLDIPLEMDTHNLFGAFTESFDLMRVELRTARENEYKANLSKKELVASLSHDIKTPIASIMSAMDIMLIKAKDDKEKKMVESVNAKLEQINSLVTNMFHATLEELQALKVKPREMQSTEVATLIKDSDYEDRVTPFVIPDCIVVADSLRLQQVFDNIISNSYKYAKTAVVINAYIDRNYLVVEVQDFGCGVSEEEIPLLRNKFYRGKNAEKSDGYGLGLYISHYFVNEMAGKLICKNRSNGFSVTIMLMLAGQNI
ncbi:MAG: HAMP domain-containing histidine kinase [Oscillospiraceae bacterium]|nr:HAMP domain-containing histidine kinase [Oscillospiraceae bacterium]